MTLCTILILNNGSAPKTALDNPILINFNSKQASGQAYLVQTRDELKSVPCTLVFEYESRKS